jgi:hypothetical protein
VAQTSGPISQGTTAERQFTDVLWRDRFGDEPGVLGDMNGTAYALALPSSSDVVSVGSATQTSLATVAGFVHKIPAASPETITIPAASGSSRMDIIALRYDPAYTGAPGPVRLVRIAGSGASLPSYDSSPPGIEELPLWSILRAPGQNLSQATVKRLFPRVAPSLEVAVGSPLPSSSPLGTIVRQGATTFRRALDASQVPSWLGIGGDSYYDEGAGTSYGIGTTATAPTSGAQLALPAGVFDIDLEARFNLSISTLTREYTLLATSGATELFYTAFTVNTSVVGQDASRNHSGTRRITLAAPATVVLKVKATAVGGTQNLSMNLIRARRVET